MTRIRWYGPTLLLLITVLLVMLVGPQLVQRLEWYRMGAQITLARDTNLQNVSLTDLSSAFRNVAKVVRPSVVHIQVEGRLSRRSHLRQELEERLRRRFFQDPRALPRQEQDDKEDPTLRRYDIPRPIGNGSGWVYDDQGYIITNHHVVKDGETIRVKLSNKSVRVAQIIGTDPSTDIAVLKIPPGDLHPVSLAKGPVEQGEIVFAFGSPFGYEFSMSQGIVSAKGRQIGILLNRHGYEDFIQTDASINRGNSGGPLTNIFGEVVGMNTAIATRGNPDANFNGMGFAIPSAMIQKVVDELITDGKVVRGYLGVMIKELDEKMAWTFGYKGKGVLVYLPQEGFPAAEAGVRGEDIITKVDGTPITSTGQLRDLIASYAPETMVNLEIYRGKSPNEPGETLTIPVKIVAKPEDPLAVDSGGLPDEMSPSDAPDSEIMRNLKKLGLERVVTTTRERYGRDFVAGVVIRSVREDSAAAVAGLRPGHIVTEVFGASVKNTEELVAELAKHDLTKLIRITVHDGQFDRAVFLELPSHNDRAVEP